MLTPKKTTTFYFKDTFHGNIHVENTRDTYILMHPSSMKSLRFFKGSLTLLFTEKGQLLFRCCPWDSLENSALMLPLMNIFDEYSKGPVFCMHYPLFVPSADLITLRCDSMKKFMKTESFKQFIQNQLNHIYIREDLTLHISYLGYICSFTVNSIVCETVSEIKHQESLQSICTDISRLNISEDNLNSSIDETSFICSTPISSKQTNYKNLLCQETQDKFCTENNAIQKPQQFYVLTSHTKLVFQFLEENKNNTGTIAFNHLCGLENQVKDIQSTIQSLLNKDSLCKVQCHGIILVGASGTGKSALVKACGNEFHLPIFKLNNINSDRNEEECRSELKKLFAEVVDNSPSILFLDGIDELSRSNDNIHLNSNSNFLHLLSNMIYDLLRTVYNVLIIGAARNISAVDASLRKPGILEKEIYFEIPSGILRKEILGKILDSRNHNLTSNQVKEISEMTHGFTGGDLKHLCDKAAISSHEEVNITFENLKKTLRNVKPSSMAEFVLEVPNIKWSDIGGMHSVKKAITEMVDWPLNHAEQFQKFGITPSKGILMYGPPGCSKTMIAKALVSESHLNFISIKGPQLFNKYVGESEKAVSELFKKARSAAPCVLFFDEIDSLTTTRGSRSGNSNVAERILTQLLVEIDGIDVLQGVSIIAATNRPDMIDPSFLRPGRFDQMIYVPLPDFATRKEIFEAKLKNMPHASDVNVAYLVEATEGYTGAEITDVCREAAMSVIKDYIMSESSVVKMSHFLSALKSVVPRTSEETIKFYENYSCKKS